MIIDIRTDTMVPGRLGAYLKLYEAEGMPIHVRHLGKPIGVFTTDVGTVNQPRPQSQSAPAIALLATQCRLGNKQ